jgi:hypothetical protein
VILRGMPRVRALVLLWIMATVFWAIVWPVAFLPQVAIEEGLQIVPKFIAQYASVAVTPSEWSANGLVLLAVAAGLGATQVLFVAPLVGEERTDGEPRSMRVAAIAATGVAIVVVAALVFVLVEGVVLLGADRFTPGRVGFNALDARPWQAFLAMLAAWIAGSVPASIVLWRVGASSDPNALERLVRTVTAGTSLNLVLALPLYLLARRRESCVCSLPTFYSIACGLAALLWLTGPFAVLFLTREYRRMWRRTRCGRCGYPRLAQAARCSECGMEFEVATQTPEIPADRA